MFGAARRGRFGDDQYYVEVGFLSPEAKLYLINHMVGVPSATNTPARAIR
jgi:hypothetical protein